MEEKNKPEERLWVCWTTVNTEESAQNLAKIAIESELAVCAQIDQPIESLYRWNGEVCQDKEFRIWFKVLSPRAEQLRRTVIEAHPYDTPQWIVIEASNLDEKYLKWAQEASNLRRF